MNQFPNQTNAQGIRHRHPRHPHRFSRGSGEGQGARCLKRRRRALGHLSGPASTGQPGGFARRGHPGHPGRGRNRRAVHELHKALAEVARARDEQLRSEAAQIITEAAARLNGLLHADR